MIMKTKIENQTLNRWLMLYAIVTILTLLAFGNKVNAQNWQWGKKYGTNNIGNDAGTSIVTDNNGYIYVTGHVQTPSKGDDIFLIKYDTLGNVIWQLQTGGTNYDAATGIKLDLNGNIFITGNTNSSDFPVLSGFQMAYVGGISDAFLMKYDPNGTLLWSTYYGGNNQDVSRSITVDNLGNIFVAGSTISTDFPVMNTGAYFQGTHAGGIYDAFILKFDNSGNRLWATYYGGSSADECNAVTIDNVGNIFICGATQSTNFPITTGAFQTTLSGSNDAFVVKFDATGTQIWSTYYGGSNGSDNGSCITTDNSGNVLVGGTTSSNNFPVTNGSFSLGGDGFLFKLNTNGTPIWSSYSSDLINCGGLSPYFFTTSIKTNNVGEVYVTGRANSTLVVRKYDSSGNMLWTLQPITRMCDPLHVDYIYGVDVDFFGNIYVSGNLDMTTVNFGTDNISFGAFTAKIASYLPFPNDSVWPGDANDNNIANNMDLLQLGIAWGDTGPARAGATINWQAEYCAAWANSTLGVNNNNADCDGDGVVGYSDTTAIIKNYGLTHTQKLIAPQNVFGAPVLAVNFPSGTFSNGTVVNVPITLGTSIIPANNIYGIAFSINYSPNIVDTNSVTTSFNPSWMGTYGTNLAAIGKNLPKQAQVDIGITRTDHMNISGNGEVCSINITVNNVSGIYSAKMLNVYEYFTISNVVLLDKDGNPLSLNVQGDSVQILNGLHDLTLDNKIKVYPNPANQFVFVSSSLPINNIELFDITGREVYSSIINQNDQQKVDVAGLEKGVYIMTIKTQEGIVRKKIQVN